MKQTELKKIVKHLKLYSCFAVLFGLFFLSSCGLDEVVFISSDSLTRINNNNSILSSSSENMQAEFNYVEFRRAKDKTVEGNCDYMGTAVYYMIYDNIATMNSFKNQITALINSSKSGNSSTTQIISSGYKQLSFFKDGISSSPEPFCESGSGAANYNYIKLRLYKESDEYLAGVYVSDSQNDQSALNIGEPYRTGTNRCGFDFFDKYSQSRYNEETTRLKVGIKPASGDGDCNAGSSEPEAYYVKFYCFEVGRNNETLELQYSSAIDLGELYIRR